jgi:hypothetical protein
VDHEQRFAGPGTTQRCFLLDQRGQWAVLGWCALPLVYFFLSLLLFERFSNAGNPKHGGLPFPNLKSWGDGFRIGSAPQLIQWKVAPLAPAAAPHGPWIIGISGPSGCGKSDLAGGLQLQLQHAIQSLHLHDEVVVHSMDDHFDKKRFAHFGHCENPESIKIAEFMFVNFHRVMPLRH